MIGYIDKYNKQKNNLEFYLEGINNGIDWSKVEYDKFEYEIEKPNVDHQKWLTRREFLSKEFTTSWDDIPLAF